MLKRSSKSTYLRSDLLLLIFCAKTARIIDFQSGETKAQLRGHDNVVEAVVFAPVNAYAAIRELGGITVSVFVSKGSTSILIIVKSDRSKQPGLFAATGGRDKVIKIWDASTGQPIRTLVHAKSCVPDNIF